MPPLPPPAIDDAPARSRPSPLQSRITLFDAAGTPIAGRPPGTLPLARRAILVDGKTVGTLAVARTARPTDALAYAFLEQMKASLWPIAAAGVLLSALVAMLLAAHFRRPIGRLAQGARRAGRRPLRRRACLRPAQRRTGRTGAAISMRWRRGWTGAEEARRQWVADTSHELRTPLAVLRAQLEAVQDGVRSADTGHTSRPCCARCWRCRS